MCPDGVAEEPRTLALLPELEGACWPGGPTAPDVLIVGSIHRWAPTRSLSLLLCNFYSQVLVWPCNLVSCFYSPISDTEDSYNALPQISEPLSVSSWKVVQELDSPAAT